MTAMTEQEAIRVPTYDELESLYHAQCRCTDEWAEKYRAEIESKADAALTARIAELESSLAQVNARLAQAQATASIQPVAAPEPTLQDWLTIIHDNELSLGDRLQRLSVQMSGILRGDAPDKYKPHTIREQCHCALDYERALADHRRLVRELDVLLNGEEGAADQASLCDIVAQVQREGVKAAPAQAATDDVRDAIASYVADNWAMRKYALAEIETKLRAIDSTALRTTSTDKGEAA